ncbi:MAG: YveK family protein [Coprococcus sp.]
MNSNKKMAAVQDETTQIAAVNTYKNTEDDENEIDLLDMGMALLEKLPYIILCFLIGAVLFNAFAYFLIKPTYQSTAKLYVVSASDDSIVNLQDLNIGSSLTKDYEDLILSYPVLDQVIEKLGLDMDSEGLAKMITLENPSDTRVLKITVTSTDKRGM